MDVRSSAIFKGAVYSFSLVRPPPLNHDETGRRNSRISVRWSEVPVATRAVPKQVMIEVDGGAGQRPRSGR